jgi:uncharacterized protein
MKTLRHFTATLMLALTTMAGQANPAEAASVVYHLDDHSRAIAAFRNINNQLAAEPKTRIVVVALGHGVDFLLDGAMDDRKNPFEPMIDDLVMAGVIFKVCDNTLTSRQIDVDTVHPDAIRVPSGVVEITRLQQEDGFAYLKP